MISNTSFGTNVLTNNFDPGILNGWGVRPSDWNLGVSVQQQIGPRSSVDVAYTRRWYRRLLRGRQPGAAAVRSDAVQHRGARRIPGCPAAAATSSPASTMSSRKRPDRSTTSSPIRPTYGAWYAVLQRRRRDASTSASAGLHRRRRHEHGSDRRRQLRRAGAPAGARDDDDRHECFGAGLAGSAVTPLSPYCHVAFGVLTQFRGLASYIVPKIDMQLAATFQSKPGAMLAANYAVPNVGGRAVARAESLGNATNVTVNLVAPGTMYGDRINQLDFRVGKILRYRPLADAGRRSTSTTR